MKKVLSFVLVLAMILGSVSLAFATGFSDTEGTDYDEAARLLSDLGVISGYSDGTFKPENNVTRAEFAAMMIRALGFEVAGTSAVTNFSDVPAAYWASTYIKYASELGIIYGYNDGTFRPKNNITNDEAIAMLIRTLGYQAKYMTGSYPTSHINVALGLDILDGIPTGSAPATRGTIAQLVFNALGVNTVTYDGDGNIKRNGAPFLIRLGGTWFNGDEPFVVTGKESAAKSVNLNQYLGAYVKAYASKNNPRQIIAVSKVLSEFVTDTATLKGTNFAAFKEGDAIGDASLLKHPVSITTTAAVTWAEFDNGEYLDMDGHLPYDEKTAYTFAVKMDGNHVANVYSVTKWVPTETFMLDADMLEELKEDQTLNEHEFALDTKDNIDRASFGLFGVDSLDDLKEDYVVAVYEGPSGKVTRVEVGTKTVDGTVTRISSKGAVTVAGTAYKLNPTDDCDYKDKVAIDDKGTFYLDYQGRIFALDGETVAKSVGVLMATNHADVDPSKLTQQLPNGQSGYKALLFTAEGKVVEYNINKKANIVSEGALTLKSEKDTQTDDILVEYGLNSDGQLVLVNALEEVEVSKTPVSKKGIIENKIINEDTIIFSYNGGTKDYNDYSVVKRASVLGATEVNGKYAFKADNNRVVVAAIFNDLVTTDDVFVVVNGVDEVTDGYELMGFDAKTGKAVVYTSGDEVKTTDAAVLYKLVYHGTDITPTLIDETADEYGDVTEVKTTKTTCIPGKNGYTFTNVDAKKSFTVSSDAQVFAKNADGEWTVKSVNYLKGLKNKTVTFYDLDGGADKLAYEVVFVE